MANELENLSLEELKQMRAQLDEPNLEDLSLDELKAMRASLEEPEEGLIPRGVLETAADVGEFVDSYTGAPIRAGIGVLQNDFTDIGKAIEATAGQFGEDPRTAPTGKQIAARTGLSTEETIPLPKFVNTASKYLFGSEIGNISPAGIAGFGVDVAADPMNFIPAGAIAGAIGKGTTSTVKGGLKYGGKLTAQTLGKTTDVLTGTKAGTNAARMLEEGTVAAGKSLKEAFTARVSPDFERLANVAERNNIDISGIDSLEFGRESMPAQFMRKKAEGPFGVLQRAKYNEVYRGINDAIEKTVDVASGERRFVTPMDVGASLVNDFEKWKDKVFSQIDFTYNSVHQQIPGLNIKNVAPEAWENFNRKLNGLEKTAKETAAIAMSTAERAQAKDLIKAIEIAKIPDGDFKKAVKQLQSTGRTAFKSIKGSGLVPPDVEALRTLYFDMSDMLIETTEKTLGKDIAETLKANNQTIHKFITDKSEVGRVLGREIAPEKAFDKLVKNSSSRTIQNVLQFASQETVGRMKKGFFYSLVNENVDGGFSIPRFYKNLNKPSNLYKAKLLFTPEELINIQDLIELGSRMGDNVLSHSGTGSSNAWQSIKSAFGDMAQNEAVVESVKRSARGEPFFQNVALPPKGKELMTIPLGGGRRLPIKRPPVLGGEISNTYKIAKPMETYFQMQNSQEQGVNDMGRSPQSIPAPIPAKNLNRNVLTSNVFFGDKGKLAKEAMAMIASAPGQAFGMARPVQGYETSSNIFAGIQQIMQNQDVNPLITASSYYNSKYGEEITKDIIGGIASIDGTITVEKLYKRLGNIPKEARQEIIADFEQSFGESEMSEPIVIPDGNRLEIIQDVKNSVMDSTDKAKIIRAIMDRGVVSPELYKKIIFPKEQQQAKQVQDDWKRRILEE